MRPKMNSRLKKCELCGAGFKSRHKRTCRWAFRLRPNSPVNSKKLAVPESVYLTILNFKPKQWWNPFSKIESDVTLVIHYSDGSNRYAANSRNHTLEELKTKCFELKK